VEPGNIFRRKDSIKMPEEILEEEFVEIKTLDEDGNVVITKVY
jgi:hypothetical protein